MKKHVTVSLLFLCFVVAVPNLFGQACTPAGLTHAGPASNAFNFVANPNPDSDTCWSHPQGVFFVTGVTSCSSPFANQITNNAFAFTYAGLLTQDIVIPASDTRTKFALTYFLDFDDPNNDSYWNRFSASVYDVTTSTYLYQSGNYTGAMPDLFCARYDSPTMTFSGTLAGHTIRIIIHGQSAYSYTHVRVYGIAFTGWN